MNGCVLRESTRPTENVGAEPVTKNMGTTDRVLRILAALAIGVLYLAGSISGLAAMVLGVVALVFVVSSAVGFCPIYVPLGISTRRQPSAVHV